MPTWPNTETHLVRRLADPADDAAWSRFDLLYRPVIYRYARSAGLQHSDAEALVGEVLTRVFRASVRWANTDGQEASKSERPDRFRAWLQRVSKNALLNLVTRQLKERGTGGTSHQIALSGRAVPDDVQRIRWESEHREHLFRMAAREVQPNVPEDHWNVFWQSHIEEQSIADVAEQFGQSIGSVYAIRSRVLKRLRVAVQHMETFVDQPIGEVPQ
ncbi:MAG: sigma-70 family RNA polymerase sigma factor [Planctomycetota bacterium]